MNFTRQSPQEVADTVGSAVTQIATEANNSAWHFSTSFPVTTAASHNISIMTSSLHFKHN